MRATAVIAKTFTVLIAVVVVLANDVDLYRGGTQVLVAEGPFASDVNNHSDLIALVVVNCTAKGVRLIKRRKASAERNLDTVTFVARSGEGRRCVEQILNLVPGTKIDDIQLDTNGFITLPDKRRQREMDGDRYNDLEAIDSYLDVISRSRRNGTLIVDVVTVGQSFEGRTIRAVCMHGSQSISHTTTPTVLVVGGHHSREWISVEVPFRMIQRLMRSFDTNRRVRSVLSRLRVCIVPVINPDGFHYSFQSGNDEAGWPKRMWRKNRHPFPVGYVGVDLNRNYNIDFDDDGGSSRSVADETYRGSQPFSEPETSSFFQWQERMFGESLVGFLSLHSYGNEILYPLGYDAKVFGPNEELLRSLGEAMKCAIVNTSGALYSVRKAADSYPCSGDAVDALYVAHRYIPSFTIETRPSERECCAFSLPAEQIEATTSEVYAASLYMMEYVAAASTTPSTVDWEHHKFQPKLLRPLDANRDGIVDFLQVEEKLDVPDTEEWGEDVVCGGDNCTQSRILVAALPLEELFGVGLSDLAAIKNLAQTTIAALCTHDAAVSSRCDVSVAHVVAILGSSCAKVRFTIRAKGPEDLVGRVSLLQQRLLSSCRLGDPRLVLGES